jgi:uncharacterized protein with HEPN domain
MLDYNVYIEQILEMIERLKSTNLDRIDKDKLVFDATIMRLQVIGESAGKISSKIREANSHIDWNSLIKTRDFISHNYEIVDSTIVREFILNKIFPMKENLKKILKKDNTN